MSDDPNQVPPPGRDCSADGEPSSGATLDDVFRAFADECRRNLLVWLARTEDGVLSLECAVHSIALATDTRPDRIEIALRHNHLPKLEAAGLITFDPDDRTISYLGHELAEEVVGVLASERSGIGSEPADSGHHD